MQHPTEFYVAHRTFRLNGRGPEWGSLTDGPSDRVEMASTIADSFDDEAPSLDNLRVWHFQLDAPVRDVTEDFVLAWEAAHAKTDEELAEQAACDRADAWRRECAA